MNTDRQMIEDLLSALEYHQEQTRPIHFTATAIQAAREHLRKPRAEQQEPVEFDIQKAVDRFLGWKLPDDFFPDAGISFDREYAVKWGFPTGTNLFHAGQAKQMLEYVLQGAYQTALRCKPEHKTSGDPCWCNPDVIEEENGNVIVHNDSLGDWQQYAKPGETPQSCIERHRAEQDALLELLKQAREQPPAPRKPLTDEELCEICDSAEPYGGDWLWSDLVKFARAIEARILGSKT